MPSSKEARARAEAQFTRATKRAAVIRSESEIDAEATRDKTSRLKSLRLAKEAGEVLAASKKLPRKARP